MAGAAHGKAEEAITLIRRHFGWIVGSITLLVVIAIIGGYFGPQVLRYYSELRPRLTYTPVFPRGWDSTPKPLLDTTASKAEGTTLSYYGWRFEVPWKGFVKEWQLTDLTEVQFKDGQEVQFIDPSYFQGGDSQYEEFRVVISMTPSQISPFVSHRVFARRLHLLDMKGAWFEHNGARPDIFSFETPNYRGFEFSDLSQGRQWVEITLFDTHEHRFQLKVSVIPSSATKLTQSDINRIIQSFSTAPPKADSDNDMRK
ncbi:MAG: hypothetical protein ACHQJX_13050 [Candidatus Acidiferrales bacterium]